MRKKSYSTYNPLVEISENFNHILNKQALWLFSRDLSPRFNNGLHYVILILSLPFPISLFLALGIIAAFLQAFGRSDLDALKGTNVGCIDS